MKLKQVNEIPMSRIRADLQKMIDEFADSDVKFVEFVWEKDEYKHRKSAYGSITMAVRRSTHRNIKTKMVDGHIYLIKK